MARYTEDINDPLDDIYNTLNNKDLIISNDLGCIADGELSSNIVRKYSGWRRGWFKELTFYVNRMNDYVDVVVELVTDSQYMPHYKYGCIKDSRVVNDIDYVMRDAIKKELTNFCPDANIVFDYMEEGLRWPQKDEISFCWNYNVYPSNTTAQNESYINEGRFKDKFYDDNIVILDYSFDLDTTEGYKPDYIFQYEVQKDEIIELLIEGGWAEKFCQYYNIIPYDTYEEWLDFVNRMFDLILEDYYYEICDIFKEDAKQALLDSSNEADLDYKIIDII